jgi:hypothetical protein
MAKEETPLSTLERGELRFFVRPRVEVVQLQSVSDVQKLDLTLSPDAEGWMRRIHVGRKRMPAPGRRERHWAYVDRIGEPAVLVAELLTSRTYETKTRGTRHQRGAAMVARGRYVIASHGEHTHLFTDVAVEEGFSQLLVDGLGVRPRASYITAVFNPEAKGRGRSRGRGGAFEADDDDAPFGEPSLYDDDVADRFGGHRFAPLTPELIDGEGAELLLIGGGEPSAAALELFL